MFKYFKNGDYWRLIFVLFGGFDFYICHDAASYFDTKSTRNCLEKTKNRHFGVLVPQLTSLFLPVSAEA